MKKAKRSAAVLLAAILTISSLAACSGSNSNKSPSNENPSQNGASNELAMTDGKYDPPVTITTVKAVTGEMKFKNNETIDDNVHYKWAKEKLGIEIKNLWSVTDQNNAYLTKIQLALSANDKMPDVLVVRDNNLAELLIDSGKFREVGDLFDQYASDTWKEGMNYDPTVWYQYTRDGKKMGIPILDFSMNADPVLWIREDWMRNLNLEAPKTLDDVEKIMEAFTNGDPDGNGQKDTLGLAVGFKSLFTTWMSDSGWIFGAYGAMPNQWNKASDGTLAYGSIQPEVKLGLAKMREWMEKGYISSEAGLHDEAKASELFTGNKAGIVAGPHWMAWWPLSDMKANFPDAEYKAYPIPVGPDGKSGRHGTPNYNGVVLINKDMEHPEAFFTYQNYLYDHYANPQTGGEFENGLAKGYDWDEVDGQIVKTDKVPGGEGTVDKYTLLPDGARLPHLYMNALGELATGKDPETPFEKLWASKANSELLAAAAVVLEQQDIQMNQMFTGAFTPTMKAKGEILAKLELETFTSIVYGKTPVDEFDKFVEKYNSTGGSDIHKEVNEWYKSVAE